ncbi:1,2-dihydroxy-3-keto-5-methylthiopentene dioxygenase [Nocardia rhizosphaerae]|uniref:Acireductone dioxygenase n=1 Tax=Nocardia rhizosphaerae TaxID=1691571 RepID=A0ABV8L3M6_9NOCA
MTLLQVMAADNAAEIRVRTSDFDEIDAELEKHSVGFTRWETRDDAASVDSDLLLASYAPCIASVNQSGRFQHIDIVRIHPDDDNPEWQATAANARAKFLDEHRHAEAEVRCFAAGRGCFYLHVGDEVLAIVCEAGDVLAVPAGTLHWFDMGTRPDFVAIRFFEEADGWIGDFTGDKISARFPTLDELLAAP